MNILRSLDELHRLHDPVVMAIGVFDGLHLGHQQVIRLCREMAEKLNAAPWVMTFEPHPLRVVMPSAAPRLLTTLDTKLALIESTAVAGGAVIPFTPAFADIEPEAFLDQLVQRIPHLRGIVIGENWRFGRQARGNVDLLKKLAAPRGIHVSVATPVTWKGAPVSSSRIREAIASGRLDDAALMLGRPFSVRGPVIHGQKRGRRLGFPTANLDLRGCALPPSGIYASIVRHDGASFPGAVYLPAQPEPQHGTLEVHLIDFEGDLYGKVLPVEFIGKIREDNRRFSNEADLVCQIRHDVETIRNEVARQRPAPPA